jgi:Protein of unknown function (DUF1573)
MVAIPRCSRFLLTVTTVHAAAILALLAATAANRTPPPFSKLTTVAAQLFPLEVTPDPISLGTLEPGRSAVAKLTLRNSTSHPVLVSRVQTSCHCLNVAGQPTHIGSGQVADLTVKFDPTDDPDFRGGLSVDVLGHDPTGELVFQTRVRLEVRVQPGKAAD